MVQRESLAGMHIKNLLTGHCKFNLFLLRQFIQNLYGEIA